GPVVPGVILCRAGGFAVDARSGRLAIVLELQGEPVTQTVRHRVAHEPEPECLRETVAGLSVHVGSRAREGQSVRQLFHATTSDEVEDDAAPAASDLLTRDDDVDVGILAVLCPVDEADLPAEVRLVAGG